MHPDTTESLNFPTSSGTSDADGFDSHDMTDDGGGEVGPVDEHQRVLRLSSQFRFGIICTSSSYS